MMLDERSLVLTALLITLSMEVKCQQLYSSGVQWMPTGNGNELQIYSHLSWQQFNIGTCILPACLTAYKLTNKSALTFGRLSGYKWTCAKGCSTSLTVSGFDGVYFTEVKNYTGAMWEAGDETKAFNFGATVTSEIELELSFQNGSTPYQTMLSERAMLTLATRNDTNRTNMSPSLVVFPMYSVPLGCSITINLHPYDGDGDFVTCRLTHPLPGCKLNQDSCTLTMSATGANGYVVDGIYSGEVIAEDYNEEKVTLSKGGNSVISKGPFSRVPIMISVHVTASPVSSTCLDSPRLKPVSEPVISIQPLDVMSRVIESYTASTVFLTVGRQGSTFDKMTPSGVNVTLTSTDVGVYRTCTMGYNQEGVPGESMCYTILVGDTDDCARNPCTSRPGGTCHDFYNHYTCDYPTPDSKSKIGLIVGATVGALCVVGGAVALSIYMYTRNHKRQRESKIHPDPPGEAPDTAALQIQTKT